MYTELVHVLNKDKYCFVQLSFHRTLLHIPSFIGRMIWYFSIEMVSWNHSQIDLPELRFKSRYLHIIAKHFFSEQPYLPLCFLEAFISRLSLYRPGCLGTCDLLSTFWISCNTMNLVTIFERGIFYKYICIPFLFCTMVCQYRGMTISNWYMLLKGKISFLQCSDTGYNNHIPG